MVLNIVEVIDNDEAIKIIKHKIPNDVMDRIKANKEHFKEFANRYSKLISLGGDVAKCANDSKSFGMYLTTLKQKLLGATTDPSSLTALDMLYWEQQNDFIDMVKGNKLTNIQSNRKGTFDYTTINDILIHFSADQSRYESFKDVDGNYLFELNETSLGMFMNKISRSFKNKKIRIDNKLIRIFEVK